MGKTLTQTADLISAGLVQHQAHDTIELVRARYSVAITSDMADLIDAGDPLDPIAAQFVPTEAELNTLLVENGDPIADAAFTPTKGLVHRYRDRVLLKVVSACPVYCRFCFRREMVGPGGEGLTGADLDRAIDYIAARPEIFEVIMTGGDPFMLSPRRIEDLTKRLAAIDHVKMIRWHTRVPMVDSARVTNQLVDALVCEGVTTWVAIHANHAREFTPSACKALALLTDGGVALVSQSVLLKGVNCNLPALSDLMRTFLINRVKPYYLHHPDLAPGTSHFRPTIEEGQALMDQLRKELSGLAQPIYVLDVPGGATKALLSSQQVRADQGVIRVRGGDGAWLDYAG